MAFNSHNTNNLYEKNVRKQFPVAMKICTIHQNNHPTCRSSVLLFNIFLCQVDLWPTFHGLIQFGPVDFKSRFASIGFGGLHFFNVSWILQLIFFFSDTRLTVDMELLGNVDNWVFLDTNPFLAAIDGLSKQFSPFWLL